MPYINMNVEDVMMLDDKKAVSLEYIFYPKKGKYSKMKATKQECNNIGKLS